MHRYGLSAILLSLSCGLLPAATEPIGVATASGPRLLLNNAALPGNATVFEGSTLGAGDSGVVNVRLTDGSRVRFSLESSGKMYRDHVDLIQGSAQISDYTANANGLKISAKGNSSASVSMQGKTIQVAALSGDVHVFNAQGISVANLLPGRVLSFLPQDAGASAPSSLIGCAVKSGSNVLLTDETSNVTAQLRGGNVRAGHRVQVSGTMVPNATPAAGATQVITVTNVKEVGGTCPATAAAGTAPTGSAPAGAAGGSHGYGKVVVGAIAAAAVVGGVTAAVVVSGGSSNTASSSTTGTPGSPSAPVTVPVVPPSTASSGTGSTSYTVVSGGVTYTVTITVTVGATPGSSTATVVVVPAAGSNVPSGTISGLQNTIASNIANNPTAITTPTVAVTQITQAFTTVTGTAPSSAPSCVSPCAAL